jgi:hypothetical protein
MSRDTAVFLLTVTESKDGVNDTFLWLLLDVLVKSENVWVASKEVGLKADAERRKVLSVLVYVVQNSA